MSSVLQYKSMESELDQLCNRFFSRSHPDGLVRCENTVLSARYPRYAEDILNFEIRDDDVWVASFPKTGTTWTQEMVWCIGNNLDFIGAKTSQQERFPYFEIQVKYCNPKEPQPTSQGEPIYYPPFVTNSLDFVRDLPSPRYIKTHLPFHLLPLQLQRRQTKAKIVYVSRNVKDTCISYFHHCQMIDGFDGSLEEFATLFMNDALPYSPFWNNVMGYWERREDPNILFLKFEDLKKDLPSVVLQTAKFMGKALTDEQIERLCEHLSFANMKENPAVNLDDFVKVFSAGKQAGGRFMRSGQVGQWKTKFSEDFIERFDQWADDNLRDSGLTF